MSNTENKGCEKVKTSWLAMLAFVLSISGFCTKGITSVLGFVLGIIALLKIRKSSGKMRGRGFAIAGIVLSGVVLLFTLWNLMPFVKAKKTLHETKRILSNGRLANLPVSAEELEVGGWHGLFSGEDYIKFCASAEDINKFISESKSIKAVTPEIFNDEHRHLPQVKDVNQNTYSESYLKHKYYHQDRYVPNWYKPTIKKSGRMFEIPGDPNKKGHNWGSVIINDETNTVYINVIWS